MLHIIFWRWGNVINITYFTGGYDVINTGSKLASWYNSVLSLHIKHNQSGNEFHFRFVGIMCTLGHRRLSVHICQFLLLKIMSHISAYFRFFFYTWYSIQWYSTQLQPFLYVVYDCVLSLFTFTQFLLFLHTRLPATAMILDSMIFTFALILWDLSKCFVVYTSFPCVPWTNLLYMHTFLHNLSSAWFITLIYRWNTCICWPPGVLSQTILP